MKTSKMPVGIIGCGRHAQHHAESFGKSFKVFSVWDPDKKAMKQISSVKKSTTIEKLLAEKAIKAVMICSPDEHHLVQIEMALAAGKHVFCEKPLLVPDQDIKRLEAVFALAKEKGLVLTSCHPRRLDIPFLWFAGYPFPLHFGKVLHFSFDFTYHTPSNEWKAGRSLLLDHANHEVDLMNFLFGIEGFTARKVRDSFDHYEVEGIRDDGISFHFLGTRRLKAGRYPERCRIRFERGEVELDMSMKVARITDHETGKMKTIKQLGIDYNGRLKRVARNFRMQIQDPRLGYLSEKELIMNTEVGIVLQNEGIQRIDVRK